MLESLIVVAFLIAVLTLLAIGAAVALFGFSSRDGLRIPFLTNRALRGASATLLVVAAIGFPVVLGGNERAELARFILSGITLLVAACVAFGQRARWAIWTAGALVAIMIGALIVGK